jgi:hypothetical protein
VKGQPAINARHWVFVVNAKGEITVRPEKFEPNLPIEYLKSPPREFRSALPRPLTQAEAPHMEVHALPHAPGSKGAEASRAAVAIRFDAKSQTFMEARQEMRAGRSSTVFAPMSNRYGSLQARGESYAGGTHSAGSGGRSSGSTAGSSHGSSSHGRSSPGSASSHGGGSTSGSSSSSSSAVSSSGSHH